ncbi:hypothetical protein WJX74_002505 [Apatococcus lobatus]|uniref:Ubiquitin-like domain-containing protein n=2 Tax=Apatococcus TaxID=904362 RepID=A0AAW1S961_9CHLO
MKLLVQTASGKELVAGGIAVQPSDSVEDLQKQLQRRKSQYHPSRQRLSLQPAPGEKRGQVLAPGTRLAEYNLQEGQVLIFKDLGPQVGYATVYFWEYFGPLMVYALLFYRRDIFYPAFRSKLQPQTLTQQLAFAFWTFHFTKRILETYFVHKFSHGTMPLRNLFKNCSYYWSFAAFVGYFLNHPLYTPPGLKQTYIALAFAMIWQLANFRCHLILASLRGSSSKGYQIPRGFLFEYVTCANYMCEVFAWVCFAISVQTLAVFIFIGAGGAQMCVWAQGKHRRLRKMFDGQDGRPKYPRRWIMLPPFF